MPPDTTPTLSLHFCGIKNWWSVLNKNYKTTTTITTKQTINMPVDNHHHRCNELRECILLQGRFPEYTRSKLTRGSKSTTIHKVSDSLERGDKYTNGGYGWRHIFADILCNNQMYSVWGGGYQIWIVFDVFCCLFDTSMLGGEQTLNIHTTNY